jgi:hypothetical protein
MRSCGCLSLAQRQTEPEMAACRAKSTSVCSEAQKVFPISDMFRPAALSAVQVVCGILIHCLQMDIESLVFMKCLLIRLNMCCMKVSIRLSALLFSMKFQESN